MPTSKTGTLCSVRGCTNRSTVHNLSFFGYPKEADRREIWMKRCGTEHLANNLLKSNNSFRVCGAHFEKKMFLNPSTKGRLVFNAVPTLFIINNESATNVSQLDVSDTKDLKPVNVGWSARSSLNSLNAEIGYKSMSAAAKIQEFQRDNIVEKKLPNNESMQSYDVWLEHNYSTTVNNMSSNSTCTSNYNIPVHQQNIPIKLEQLSDTRIVFDQLNTWELKLPTNWQKYLSLEKKFFGVSEIIFVQKDNLNSFMRKTIIVDEDLKLTCNILGKNICGDQFVNSFHKLESQLHLINLIDELASMKICRGLDLLDTKKYDSFFPVHKNITIDTMQTKRHLKCPIIIPNRFHCSFCIRAKKSINQHKAQWFSNTSSKRAAAAKTIAKSKRNVEILRIKKELQKQQKNRFKSKIDLLLKNVKELQNQFNSINQFNIDKKFAEINCPQYQ